MIDCTVRVGTFCKTPQLSNFKNITLTEQFFPSSLIFFTICAEKVCYKLCNGRYKLSNTCYKLCNMRYKLCNKNFQVHRKNFQGHRKNFQGLRKNCLPENRLTDGRKDSCIIANAHFQGYRMGNQGFKGGGICNKTGLKGGKSSKIYALACPKIS